MAYSKRIYIGADHAGYELKEKIRLWLEAKKIPFLDAGNSVLDQTDDYPDFAEKVARKAVMAKSLGILVCGSAQGMCIAANKIRGARAVIPANIKEARISREHNDANIICLSGWNMRLAKAKKIIEAFLTTPFSNAQRHVRRINKIRKLEMGLK